MLYKLSWTKIVWEDSFVVEKETGNPRIKVETRDQNETLIVEEEDFSGAHEDEAALPYNGKICKNWIDSLLPFTLTWSDHRVQKSESGALAMSVSHTSYVVTSIVPFVEKRAREE
jgi:hypothetical protein